MKTFTLSWKPKRIGPIYCAPACGRDCTYEELVRANKNAAELCTTLDRTSGIKGWTPHVWENLGWHYSAVSPCRRVNVHSSYTAFLGPAGEAGGQLAASRPTPGAAVKAVIAKAKTDLKRIGAILQGL